MESIIWIVIFVALALIRVQAKKRADGDKKANVSAQSANRPRRTPPQQVQRTAASIAEAKAKVNRSLAGMNDDDDDVPQPTKIEKRRAQQQATADKSRIHQNLHEKEQQELEAKMKQAMESRPQRFAFEDTDLMAEVADLMVCGYPTKRSGQRDFIAEGNAFLTRISTNSFE